MNLIDRNSGFTMIELLFVIVVIGVMLAVIAPRAYRANIDSKYGVVRQEAVELVSYATEWANQGMASQDREDSSSTLNAYMASLTGAVSFNDFVPTSAELNWIADSNSNWNSHSVRIGVEGRNGSNALPEVTIKEMIPSVKIPVNPFNGVSVFAISNHPTATPITGAIACAGIKEVLGGEWNYYALLFQGTDSTAIDKTRNSFYGGQSADGLPGLRNGIFLARER